MKTFRVTARDEESHIHSQYISADTEQDAIDQARSYHEALRVTQVRTTWRDVVGFRVPGYRPVGALKITASQE